MSDAHGVARDQLRSFIERIERLEEEKKTIADDIKDVYGEAKSMGFDTKVLRKVISIRKIDADVRAEQEAILDSYLHALGMIEQPGFFDDEPRQSAPVDREARAKRRTSEAMDDNKALSAQMLADGLISEVAHAEHLAMCDAVARKYGAGVIDPDTGEILDDAPRADGGLDIVTKHTEIASASQGEAEVHSDQRETDREAAATGAGANEGGEDVESSATRVGLEGGPVNLEPTGPVAERATHSPEEANEKPGSERSVARTDEPKSGGDRDPVDAALVTAGETAISFTVKPPSPLRPHCRQPEACGGYGRNHCHICAKAMREREPEGELA